MFESLRRDIYVNAGGTVQGPQLGSIGTPTGGER